MLDFHISMEIESSSTKSSLICPVFKEEESLDDSMNGKTICGGKNAYLNVYDCQFKRPGRIPLVSSWCELSNGISSREILNNPCSSSSEESQSKYALINDSRPPESSQSTTTEDRTFCNGEHSRELKINSHSCQKNTIEKEASRLKNRRDIHKFEDNENSESQRETLRKTVNGFYNGHSHLTDKQNIIDLCSLTKPDDGYKSCLPSLNVESEQSSIENQDRSSTVGDLNNAKCKEETLNNHDNMISNCVARDLTCKSVVAVQANKDQTKNGLMTKKADEDSCCLCKWINCNDKLKTALDLKIHVKETHVKTMAASDLFFCFWEGCKVYNKPSSSYNWLVKHVNTHVGIRPFQCFIDPCDQSFASQNALVRHVQAHFNERSKYYKKTKGSSKNTCNTPSRGRPQTQNEVESGGESKRKELLSKKFKMSMKRRRTVAPGKSDAGFDRAAMHYIKKKLLVIENDVLRRHRTNGMKVQRPKQILGKRISESGNIEYLISSTEESPAKSPTEWITEDSLPADLIHKTEHSNKTDS